jgi:hypothetical protein
MHKTIHSAVAEQIKDSGQRVVTIVVDKLVQVEIEKRTEALLKGLAKVTTAKNDLKKLDKPDIKQHFPDGEGGFLKPVEGYSEDLMKKVNGAKEALAKLEKILDTALEKNDGDSYGKLYEAVK